MKKTSLIIFYFLLPLTLLAQSKTNLENDKKFFVEKSIDYNKWLKQSGLGKVLRVETVRVGNTELSLDLGFYTTNGDTVTRQWNALKMQFEQQDKGVTLEEELFNKMLYFMEIKPSQGYVQLFNSYDTKKDLYVCFYRGIRFENGRVTVKEEGCKTVIDSIRIEPVKLLNQRVVKGDITEKSSKDVVFDKIMKFAERRFKPQKCELRVAKIDTVSMNDELHFIVTDLCQEILRDETNPFYCEVVKSLCTSCRNCRKREYLEMHIRYKPQPNGGYRIYLNIDAKIASGTLDKVERGAYYNMEFDYQKYVKEYAERFKDALLTELKK